MTVEAFIIMLAILSTATSLFTEAVKKFLDSIEMKYACNIVALYCAVIVGMIGMASYYIFINAPVTITNITTAILMIIANWISAMVGYDKVIQVIKQIEKIKG